MIDELVETLDKPRLKAHWTKQKIDIVGLIEAYREMLVLVVPKPLGKPVSRDSDDDEIIATALAAKAQLLVSGDKDLLVLGAYEGVALVTVNEAMARLF